MCGGFRGLCFFFSSRRRHTRYWRDWSSDVCSSDLVRVRRSPLIVKLSMVHGPWSVVRSQNDVFIVQWPGDAFFPRPVRLTRDPTTDDLMSSHYIPQTRIPTIVFPTSSHVARHVALMIESLIRQNNATNRATVLGLATGSTPVGLYRELIRLHKDTGLDLSRVMTFNLDEY